jgi:hypothetical protein
LLSQFRDFPFRRLLRLAGSRWRYSSPPPHGGNSDSAGGIIIKPQHGPHRNNRFQNFLYCCVRKRCYGNSFASNGRIHLFHNSGFQPSCHNNIRLVLIKIVYDTATVRPCVYVAVGLGVDVSFILSRLFQCILKRIQQRFPHFRSVCVYKGAVDLIFSYLQPSACTSL